MLCKCYCASLILQPAGGFICKTWRPHWQLHCSASSSGGFLKLVVQLGSAQARNFEYGLRSDADDFVRIRATVEMIINPSQNVYTFLIGKP